MNCKKVSKEFNHAVGEMVGTMLQFFGCLYLILAFVTGVSVLGMGTYNVLDDWHTKYGLSFEGVFWIITPCIGIFLLVVDYGRALWRSLQEWIATKQTKCQSNDG